MLDIRSSPQEVSINGGVCYLNELPIHAKIHENALSFADTHTHIHTCEINKHRSNEYRMKHADKVCHRASFEQFTNAIKANPKTISTNTQIYMCVLCV